MLASGVGKSNDSFRKLDHCWKLLLLSLIGRACWFRHRSSHDVLFPRKGGWEYPREQFRANKWLGTLWPCLLLIFFKQILMIRPCHLPLIGKSRKQPIHKFGKANWNFATFRYTAAGRTLFIPYLKFMRLFMLARCIKWSLPGVLLLVSD